MTTAEQWAIVELFGHGRIAGKISNIAGPMIRVDVPKTSTQPEYTRLYGMAAIYSITFVGEEIAKAAAESISDKPVTIYMPRLEMLKAGQESVFVEEENE